MSRAVMVAISRED